MPLVKVQLIIKITNICSVPLTHKCDSYVYELPFNTKTSLITEGLGKFWAMSHLQDRSLWEWNGWGGGWGERFVRVIVGIEVSRPSLTSFPLDRDHFLTLWILVVFWVMILGPISLITFRSKPNAFNTLRMNSHSRQS